MPYGAAQRETIERVVREQLELWMADRCSLENCDPYALSMHALLLSYAHRTLGDVAFRDGAYRDLVAAAANLEHGEIGPHLYGGSVGVAWVFEHLMRCGFTDAIDENTNDHVDAVLLEALEQDWQGQYDLIAGLVGIGVYALERLPAASGAELIAGVVGHLEKTARPQGEGVLWWTEPQDLPEKHRSGWPGGYSNTGLAHGSAGVVGFLAGAVLAGQCKEAAAALLGSAVVGLLGQRCAPNDRSVFAPFCDERGFGNPARTAWCYGDPGVSIALLRAGEALHRPDWIALAVEVARRAAARDEVVVGVADAGLCHGSMGLAHIFGRFGQATGDAYFNEPARRWLDVTLRIVATDGVGFHRAERNGEMGIAYRADTSFLSGANGTILALLAAVSASSSPDWDRKLLISVRGSHLVLG